MLRKRISIAAIAFLGAISPIYSQSQVEPVQPVQPHPKTLERRGPDEGAQPAKPAEAQARKDPAPKETPGDYILGPDDQIVLWTPEADELDKKLLRIEGNGSITIPLIGTMQAGGRTPPELAADIAKKLEKYYRNPQVVVSVSEYRSQPVSVLGSVNTPGVHQVQGRKTLLEMLSLAGGTRPDAGPTVIVTRHAEWGPIPVEGAKTDPSGQFSTAEIDLKGVTSSDRPQDNIAIKPNDTITVPKARLVYVLGEVERAGGFVLTERDGLSVIQALSMAGGMKPTAAPGSARILRRDESGPKEGMPVNLKEILAGKGSGKDFILEPDDILFVPDSKTKRVITRAAEMALQTVSGVVIWRAGR
jgi:polysaccharide export outer membrane protein